MEDHELKEKTIHARINPKGLYPVWYTHLAILSDSYVELAEKKIKM